MQSWKCSAHFRTCSVMPLQTLTWCGSLPLVSRADTEIGILNQMWDLSWVLEPQYPIIMASNIYQVIKSTKDIRTACGFVQKQEGNSLGGLRHPSILFLISSIFLSSFPNRKHIPSYRQNLSQPTASLVLAVGSDNCPNPPPNFFDIFINFSLMVPPSGHQSRSVNLDFSA